MRAMPSFTSSTVPTSDDVGSCEVGGFDLAEQDVLELAGTEGGVGGHVVSSLARRIGVPELACENNHNSGAGQGSSRTALQGKRRPRRRYA